MVSVGRVGCRTGGDRDEYILCGSCLNGKVLYAGSLRGAKGTWSTAMGVGAL